MKRTVMIIFIMSIVLLVGCSSQKELTEEQIANMSDEEIYAYYEEDAQAIAGEYISGEAQNAIQKIIDGLTTAKAAPDKEKEIETIRKVCQKGKMIKVRPTRVDLMVESKSGEYFFFDIDNRISPVVIFKIEFFQKKFNNAFFAKTFKIEKNYCNGS